ncbi:MAG: PorT family protein [Dysgonamonadaceae bacterium]|jgi:hypothetical protein|nr:PorT family protein [Dysgonamonadaceae bacterium]
MNYFLFNLIFFKMKKVFKCLIFAVLFAATSVSVSADARFGARLGLPISSVKVSEKNSSSSSSGSKVGFQVGILGELPIGESFSFQPEFLFTQGGGTLKDKGGSGDYKWEEKNTFATGELQIPLNFKYTHSLGSVKIFGLAGLYGSYIVSAEGKSEYTYDGETEKETTDLLKKDGKGNRQVDQLEIGLNVAAGVELQNGLFIEAGYKHGFTNLATKDYDEENVIKKSAFSIGVGFFF